MKSFIKILLGISLVTLLVGCGTSNSKEGSGDKLKVVTSFYPMYDFTKEITADKADISVLTASGVEPHDYEPTAKDMAKIQDADVFIYNSNDMETWVKDVLSSIDTSKVTVIEASKGIELMSGEREEDHDHEVDDDHNHEGEEGHDHSHAVDPHVWLDPVLAKKEVDNIKEGLIKADESNRDVYEKQTQVFQEQLDKLNEAFGDATKNAKEKKFVTQHMAFSYLAKRYGLTQIPISGLSPEIEPTPKELKKIEDLVKEENINVIYTESSASSKVAETIVSATGVELSVLNPLESLSKQDIANGENYISVMYQNLEHLKLSIK